MLLRKSIVIILFFLSSIFPLLSPLGYAQTSQEEEAFGLAKRAFDDGLYEVSQNLFNRFLDNFPSSDKAQAARFHLGQCYFYQKNYVEAIAQFNGLLGLKGAPQSPHYPQVLYELGWCLFEQGKFQEAKEKFIEFKNKFPGLSLAQEADIKIAECLYNLKEYAELKKHLELINKSGFEIQEPAVLKFYLAESCYYTEDYACAIENYSAGLRLAKDTALINLIYLGLGWSYLKTDEYSNAKTYFDTVLQNQAEEKNIESAFLGKALVLQMSGQSKEALEMYDTFISQTKSPMVRFEAHLGKAEALYSLERYPEAIALYDEARRSLGAEIEEPALSRLRYGLGLNYLKTKDFTRALNEFSSLADETSDIKIRIASRSKIGDTYAALGDIEKAIAVYEGILKDYPDCESRDYIQNSLAIALSRAGRPTQAIDMFNAVIRSSPGSKILDEAVFYLGKTYYASGDYLSSYLTLRNFPNKFPDSPFNAQAMLLEGASLKGLGRYQEAYDTFACLPGRQASVTGISEDIQLLAEAELGMSDCLYYLGRIDEALKRLESLRSKYPDSEISRLALWRLASYNFQENKLDVSRRYLLDLINSHPQASLLDDAYFLLGASYEKEGKYPEALDSFKKIEANKLRVYPKMAEVYRAMGNFKAAVFYYQTALKEKGPDTAQIQFQLAECLEESGQLPEAIELYSHIKDERTLMVKGLLRSAKIYENKGERQSAINFYQKVVDANAEESKFAQERIEALMDEYRTGGKE